MAYGLLSYKFVLTINFMESWCLEICFKSMMIEFILSNWLVSFVFVVWIPQAAVYKVRISIFEIKWLLSQNYHWKSVTIITNSLHKVSEWLVFLTVGFTVGSGSKVQNRGERDQIHLFTFQNHSFPTDAHSIEHVKWCGSS